jgi:hypothetical protein
VWGIDLTPNPSAPDPKTIRLFCASTSDLEWLKEGISLNMEWARIRGERSSESEYTTKSGFFGQAKGYLKGEKIRGNNIPEYSEDMQARLQAIRNEGRTRVFHSKHPHALTPINRAARPWVCDM